MPTRDRKSTRLNSSHTEIYTLSLHDALPICECSRITRMVSVPPLAGASMSRSKTSNWSCVTHANARSEEHTSELQSHRDLHSFPTRRSSDLRVFPDHANGVRSAARRRVDV